MRAPFVDTKNDRGEEVEWHYYQGDIFAWPWWKWRDYIFVFLPHKLKWCFPKTIFSWWKIKRRLTEKWF
jgi:hypothetical protein